VSKQQEQGWLEWIKNSPQQLLGVIALVTAIIGFVNLFSGNYYRGFTITGFVGLAALFYLCLKVAFARDQANLGRPLRFDQSHRRIALLGIVVIPAIAVALVAFEPSRSFMATGITGLPTPTPLALSAAQPGETLLIITDFDNRSGGKIGVDPAQRIYNLISEKLPGSNLKLRVEQYHQPMKDSAEARRVLKDYGATILIWGWYDQIGAEPTIELDKNSIKLNNPDLPEFNLATPESFVIRFTEEIPAQAGYTAFFTLGMMQYQLGINDVAKEFFTQAVDSAQVARTGAVNPWEALMWRGNIYSWSGEQDLAILDYTEALALYPHREGYFNRSNAYLAQDKYDLAIADYNQAIEIDSKYKEAYGNRGHTYAALGQYDLAIADYTKSIEIDSKYAWAYVDRGIAYGAQGKYDLAIADFNKALAIDLDNEDAYFNRGNTYGAQRNYEAAIADYTKTIEIDPNYKEAYASRGVAYKAQHKYDLAVADFDKVIKIAPGFAGYYTGRGNVYADWRKFNEAIADYQKSISLDPAPYTYCVLGITYTKIGDFPSAISNLEQGVQLDIKSEYPWCKTALDNARLGTPTP
jgi:tetratricopeptide (TPR) repeat protein